MKLVFRTILFHFVCIIVFACLYYNVTNDFQHHQNSEGTLFDYLLLSTTIQAGVGMSSIYPIAFYGKLLVLFQQIIMIMSYVFIIYFFNL